jgi:pimeloyl-ACP methyl ester carboxylesterase
VEGRPEPRVDRRSERGGGGAGAADLSLGLDEAGDGEPLVLIHGLATTRLIWRRVVPLLAEERHVLALDVPGFGASTPAGPGFDLEAVADAIDDGLRDAGVEEPYDLVGHSMGGAVAVTLAVRRPERLRRLVLCAPAGLAPMPARTAAALGVAAERLVAVRRLAAPLADRGWARRLLLFGGALDGAAVPPEEVRAMILASRGSARISPALATVAACDMRPLLARLETPLGAVWGAQDLVVPARRADVLRELRPDVPIEVIDRAAHVAMMEKPHEFTQALNAVFTAAAAAPASL